MWLESRLDSTRRVLTLVGLAVSLIMAWRAQVTYDQYYTLVRACGPCRLAACSSGRRRS